MYWRRISLQRSQVAVVPNEDFGSWTSPKLGLTDGPIKLLLLEDDARDAETFQRMLFKTEPDQFDLRRVERVGEALQCLAETDPDLILLDLGLPDANRLSALEQIRAAAPRVPIVVLTGLQNEALGLEAIRLGAQDYLLKNEITPSLLQRAIRYAIERRRVEELRSLVLTDDLTGLHSRRGFLGLAEQQLKLAQRSRRALVLAFIDLDGLKQINDAFGHGKGNEYLVEAATCLRESFRASDIIGRLGGDEFAVLIVEANKQSLEVLTSRLKANLAAHNAQSNHGLSALLQFGDGGL